MRLLFLSLAVVLFTACSTIKAPITEYRIIVKNEIPKSDISGCKSKALKISQAFSSTSLMTTNMDYILENNQIFSYSQAQWSNTPNRAISLEILKSVRDTGLFKYTQNAKTRSRSDLVLETNIEDFSQYYNDDLSLSYANIVMSFTLIDLKSNKVISASTFETRVDTKSKDAQGGSEALNIALSEILEKTTIWLGSTCK